MTATDEAPARPDPAARFWEKIANRYARMPVADEAAYREKLRLTRERLSPDMRVLEIGCGTGSTAIEHAPHVAHIDAVDFSPRMIAIAREKAAAAGVANVAFREAALEDLDAAAPPYDAVLALSLLHLVDDRDRAIGRIASLLKPGGLFVSNTACLGDGMGWFRLVAPVGRGLGLLPLVRVFGLADLKASLERAGFVAETVWRPGKRPVVFVIARKAAG